MELAALDYVALVVTLVAFVGISLLHRRGLNFSLITVLALVAGAILGWLFQGHTGLLEPIGSIYIRLLLAIVAPLVIVSVLSSVTSLGSISELRSIGGKSVFWLLLLNLLAILLTLAVAIPLGIGNGANLGGQAVDAGALSNLQAKERPFTQVIVEFFPRNVVESIANNEVIPIILFSLLVAVAIALIAERHPERVRWAETGIETSRTIVYKVVGFIIKLTPYAVLTLTAASVSHLAGDLSALKPLIKLLWVSFALCLFYAYAVQGALLRAVTGLSPITFYRKFFPAQLTAFTTQSSAGTLPVSTGIQTRRLGVPAEIAGFTTPLGTTIGMPGCSGVWPMILAVYAINGFGLHYGTADYLRLAIIGVLVSIGTAGVPGTATIVAITVLTAAGLPLEVVILTLPISAVVDMARTLTNVTAAATASVIVANSERLLDRDVYNAFDPGEDEQAARARDRDDLPGLVAASTESHQTG